MTTVWTPSGMLDDAQFAERLKEAEQAFNPFVTTDGATAFEMLSLVVTARKA